MVLNFIRRKNNMSDYDLVIGEGNTGSSWTCISYNSDIAQNQMNYTIDLDIDYLKISALIYKDTKEGKHITSILEHEPEFNIVNKEKEIHSYVLKLAFKKLSLTVISAKILEYGSRQYVKGKNQMRKDLRKLMEDEYTR